MTHSGYHRTSILLHRIGLNYLRVHHDGGRTFLSSISCYVFSVGHRVSHQMVSTKYMGFALYVGAAPLLGYGASGGARAQP